MSIFFRKENLKKTIFTLCYLILGVLFCVLLTNMFNFAEFVLCYCLLLSGIICVVVYSLMPSDAKNFRLFLFGLIALIFGVFILLWPKFFALILSAIICYSGVGLIVSALKQRKNHEQGWITEFVVGIVVTSLSIVTAILSGTNTAKNILSIFFGIILLINGGLGLAELIMLAKKEKSKTVADNIQEVDKQLVGKEKINIITDKE